MVNLLDNEFVGFVCKSLNCIILLEQYLSEEVSSTAKMLLASRDEWNYQGRYVVNIVTHL